MDGWWLVVPAAVFFFFLVMALGGIERRLRDIGDVLERHVVAVERSLDR